MYQHTCVVNKYTGTFADVLAAHLIREPGSLGAVVSLARNAGRARRALTAAVAGTVVAL